jgi:hypothetical protein
MARAAARNASGTVVAFPFQPGVVELPPGWWHSLPRANIEHLLGMSLDRCYEILSWP